jgi:hypothetical protein
MRSPSALLSLFAALPLLLAADPIEKQLAIQKAMAAAHQHLQQNHPAEAVAALEAQLLNADGNKAYLTLLRDAYQAELALLQQAPAAKADRIAQAKRKLELLGGDNVPPPPVTPALPPLTVPPADPTSSGPAAIPAPAPAGPAGEAAAAFKKGEFARAERLLASIGAGQLNADQKAAWAYCRIRLAADKVNAATCDPATAAAAEKDVQDALTLIPQHAELRKVAQQVLAAAMLKGGRTAGPTSPMPPPEWVSGPSPSRPNSSSGDAVETPSFRVRFTGNRQTAEAVAKVAEVLRKEISERWSGPPAGGWEPKCEIVIHPTAEAFARATARPAGTTGTTSVRLSGGRATERRIDLRADDAAVTSNALPRELTHVILADLFPDRPPPKWAEEGMAVLAGTSEEAARYKQTLRRCARDGEWIGLAQLMELKDFPGEKITGFYCESVSLTEYLVRLRGERGFTLFLRDCDRYGVQSALRRQYSIESPAALEAAWKRIALEVSRGQAP